MNIQSGIQSDSVLEFSFVDEWTYARKSFTLPIKNLITGIPSEDDITSVALVYHESKYINDGCPSLKARLDCINGRTNGNNRYRQEIKHLIVRDAPVLLARVCLKKEERLIERRKLYHDLTEECRQLTDTVHGLIDEIARIRELCLHKQTQLDRALSESIDGEVKLFTDLATRHKEALRSKEGVFSRLNEDLKSAKLFEQKMDQERSHNRATILRLQLELETIKKQQSSELASLKEPQYNPSIDSSDAETSDDDNWRSLGRAGGIKKSGYYSD